MDNMMPFDSAIASITRQRAIKEADDAGRPPPTEAELQALIDEAERVNVYGVGYKTINGVPQQQGIGSKGRESHNHLAAIKKYEGVDAYNRELRRIWKETP